MEGLGQLVGVSNGFTPGHEAVDSTGGIRYITMQLLIQHGGDHVEEGNMEFSWGKLFDKVGEPTPDTTRLGLEHPSLCGCD